MHIEFLVEEPSIKYVLDHLLPKIFADQDSIEFEIRVYNGKKDLLRNLSNRLRGYRSWLPDDWRIVVMVDEDRQDCRKLKNQLDQTALDAGFTTRTYSDTGFYQVLNRIVIEEIEAWYFGDIAALVTAYPRLSSTLQQQSKYRNPDAIAGGTWETLEKLLMDKGYHRGGLQKLTAANEIAVHMEPSRNTSKSFQVFYASLLELVMFKPNSED